MTIAGDLRKVRFAQHKVRTRICQGFAADNLEAISVSANPTAVMSEAVKSLLHTLAAASLSAMAEDERERIVKRGNDGREAARARGIKFGRKPKLTDHQQRKARQRLEAGDSARSIAKFFCVHHTTVLRVL
jgi:DNA invertase Pin-like site-specific DNA recombinase